MIADGLSLCGLDCCLELGRELRLPLPFGEPSDYLSPRLITVNPDDSGDGDFEVETMMICLDHNHALPNYKEGVVSPGQMSPPTDVDGVHRLAVRGGDDSRLPCVGVSPRLVPTERGVPFLSFLSS